MKKEQTLNSITSTILLNLSSILENFQPHITFVHGDTTTTLATSLACYYAKLDVAHIEAGLRTGNIYSPWPEELNRKLTGHIAKYHFTPTLSSYNNLTQEGINQNNIFITGNTVIDALHIALDKIKTSPELQLSIETDLEKLGFKHDPSKRLILVTGHRRENFGDGFLGICNALKKIGNEYNKSVQIVYPVHLNPNVQKPVNKILGSQNNITLIPPLDYKSFLYLMNLSTLILTDSGGIQEEAPSLGKPVLVMREVTERPEGIESGTVKLVGTNTEKIFNTIKDLLDNKAVYDSMSHAHNPYGDGKAAKRVLNTLIKIFNIKEALIST